METIIEAVGLNNAYILYKSKLKDWKGHYSKFIRERSDIWLSFCQLMWSLAKKISKLHNEPILCYLCGKEIHNYTDYTPHHYVRDGDDYDRNFITNPLKIKHTHTQCHNKYELERMNSK